MYNVFDLSWESVSRYFKLSKWFILEIHKINAKLRALYKKFDKKANSNKEIYISLTKLK